MHTCSTIMQQVLPVIQELNWHLVNAKQVIMMDACMDLIECARFVNHLEDVGHQRFYTNGYCSLLPPVSLTLPV
jgi:hypothetical protein